VAPHGPVGAADIPDMLLRDLLIIGLRSGIPGKTSAGSDDQRAWLVPAPDMPDLSTMEAGVAVIIVSDRDV
jgi:hypothetical protein